MASPTPVLPDVGSTIVPPGFSSPSRSAARIISSAGRSFDEPPGFVVSSLATSGHGRSAPTLPSFTIGVLPMRSMADSAINVPCSRTSSAWFPTPMPSTYRCAAATPGRRRAPPDAEVARRAGNPVPPARYPQPHGSVAPSTTRRVRRVRAVASRPCARAGTRRGRRSRGRAALPSPTCGRVSGATPSASGACSRGAAPSRTRPSSTYASRRCAVRARAGVRRASTAWA